MNLYKTILFFYLTSLTIYLYGGPVVQKKVAVPDLVGMTVADVKKVLHSKSLNIGAIIPQSETDSESFDKHIVYKQNPSPRNNKGVQNYIRKGQFIDLWVVDKLTVDTLKKAYPKTRVAIRNNSR